MKTQLPSLVDELATTHRRVATHCVCCGQLLTSPTNRGLGMGPDCLLKYCPGVYGQDPESLRLLHALTHAASVLARDGKITRTRELAKFISRTGATELSDAILRRFERVESHVTINIRFKDHKLYVKTPYPRNNADEWSRAWRRVPGWIDSLDRAPARAKADGVNIVPVTSKPVVFRLLSTFFPRAYAMTPEGIVQLPDGRPA